MIVADLIKKLPTKSASSLPLGRPLNKNRSRANFKYSFGVRTLSQNLAQLSHHLSLITDQAPPGLDLVPCKDCAEKGPTIDNSATKSTGRT
jgi:hypothetical protein